MATAFPSAIRTSMNPPPPKFPAVGYVTARAKAVATAASTALPPWVRISAPTCEAIAESVTTAASRNRAGVFWAPAKGSRSAKRQASIQDRTGSVYIPKGPA
jgi:hypothetical protein